MRADYRVVSTGYFRALKIPLIAGREFNERDTAQTTPRGAHQPEPRPPVLAERQPARRAPAH